MNTLTNHPALPADLQADLQSVAQRYVDCLITYHQDGSRSSYDMLVMTQNLLNDLTREAALTIHADQYDPEAAL